MISVYSFLVAMVCYNVTIFIVALLSRKDSFLVKYSTSVLLLFAVLAIARMTFPLDFQFTLVISSYNVLPAVRDVLAMDVLPGPEYMKLGTLLMGIWIFGALVVFVQKGGRMASEIRRVKKYKPVEDFQAERVFARMGLKRARVTVTPDAVVPMETGIFKAYIFLPELDLTDEELELIIRHEYQHFKSGDTLIKIFYLALTAIFWWNPTVYIFQKNLEDLLELRCDANVTRRMDIGEKHAYLSLLLKVLKQTNSRRDDPVPAAAMLLTKAEAPGCFTARRFNYVFNLDKEDPKARKLLMALAVVIFLLSFMVVIQPAGHPEGDISEVGVAITPENAYILVQEDGTMQLIVDNQYFWNVSENMLDFEPHNILPIHYEEGIQ